MRAVVMSDSHRMKSSLFKIVERHKDNAELFIFLGDGEDDMQELELLYPNLRYECVAGNCDFYSTLPLYKEIIFAGKKIFFSHGHIYGVKHGYDEIIKTAKAVGADICLFGHTHIQHTAYDDGLYVMNPGTASLGEYGIIDIVPNGIALLREKI